VADMEEIPDPVPVVADMAVVALWAMARSRNADGLGMMAVWWAVAVAPVVAPAVHMVVPVAPVYLADRAARMITSVAMRVANHTLKALAAQAVRHQPSMEVQLQKQ